MKFGTPELQELAESPRLLELEFGADDVRCAMRRFSQIRAARSVGELASLPGGVCQAVDRGYRVIVSSTGVIIIAPVFPGKEPKIRTKAVLSRVETVTVVEIGRKTSGGKRRSARSSAVSR